MSLNNLDQIKERRKELKRLYKDELITVASYKAKITKYFNKHFPLDEMEILKKHHSAKIINEIGLYHFDEKDLIPYQMILEFKRLVPSHLKLSFYLKLSINTLKIDLRQFMYITVHYNKYMREIKELDFQERKFKNGKNI